MNWNDFNGADDQTSFELIPAKTLAKVRMVIKPGGHDDAAQGWTGGWATRNHNSGAVYLNCEFVVLEGKYARRKIWNLIGLHSEKGPNWANIGRAFIKGILNSARGVRDKDNSPTAQNARRIHGLGDLDGIEFVARIDVEKNQNGDDKNVIKLAITPDHKDYVALMGSIPSAASLPQASNAHAASTNSTSDLPSWAK
ncbi:hypothetical protein [Bartonella sp. DGB2]|uniref:hypothetical protein n=1 Tax=Bartonella sp. DGB2 TaxID=3388426 RepID=UPI00398FD1AA